MANKLNPELVQNIAELTNVKKISDLPIINVIDKDNETETIRTSQQFNNSYILSSTLLEDNSQVGGRYFNYRVKLNEVTEYLRTLSDANLAVFRNTFDFFVNSLKSNTENSYVQFAPANDIIDYENPDNNYSYTFKYKLSEVLDGAYGFTYYIGSDEKEHELTYTNGLTEGLVTNVTLEKYVRNSIATLLGVPSTPAYVTEAIDSVVEFVEWFKGYTKDKDGLSELIRKIKEKDEEIISSYTAADNTLRSYINNKINDLDSTTNAEPGKYIIGIEQNDGLITNVTSKQITIDEVEGLQSALDNINIDTPVIGVADEGNSLMINGTEYTLSLNSDKKLLFTVYTKISYTNCTSAQHFEYNSGDKSFTVSAKPTKNCIVTNRWEDDNAGTTYNANVPISANVSVSNNASGLFNLIIKETDKGATKEAIVKYAFDYYDSWQYVTDELITSSNINDKFNLFERKNSPNANGYISKYNFTVSGEKYVYILIKKSSATFIIGSGTTPGQNPGGVEKICEYQPYGNASGSPKYYLYRSSRVQTANCNITVS